jgi:hypothetical protein
MTRFLHLGSRIYRGILWLYPSDLRRDFGAEMSELFHEDLADAWRSSGLAGVIGVWWCAVCELFRIAIPSQRTNPAIVVPAIAFVLNTVIVGTEVMLPMINGVAHGLPPWRDIGPPVIWSSVAVALTSIAVVHTGKVIPPSVLLDA